MTRSKLLPDFIDSDALDAFSKRVTIDAVAVADQVAECLLEQEGFYDLLRGPLCGGVIGNVEMHDAAALVRAG